MRRSHPSLPVLVQDSVQTEWELSFNAVVTNTTTQTLAGIEVVAAAYDATGRLVAALPLSLTADDGAALAPGEALPVNATLLLDGQSEPNSLKLVIEADGRLP